MNTQSRDSEQSRDRRVGRLVWTSAVLLALATIGSAWSAWQAARWSGVQSVSFGDASELRSKAVKADARAHMQTDVDIQVFLDWLIAVRAGNDGLAAFLQKRMRDEFKPALDSWLAHRPAPGALPEGTPLEEPSYRLASRQQADRYAEASVDAAEHGRAANQIGDDFILAVVFFASTLALCGLSNNVERWLPRLSMVVLAAAMLVLGTVTLLLLPHQFGSAMEQARAAADSPRPQNATLSCSVKRCSSPGASGRRTGPRASSPGVC